MPELVRCGGTDPDYVRHGKRKLHWVRWTFMNASYRFMHCADVCQGKCTQVSGI